MSNIKDILSRVDTLLGKSQTSLSDGTPLKIHRHKEFRYSDYWPLEEYSGKMMFADRETTEAYVDLFDRDEVLIEKIRELMPNCEIVVHTHPANKPCYAVDNCRRIW